MKYIKSMLPVILLLFLVNTFLSTDSSAMCHMYTPYPPFGVCTKSKCVNYGLITEIDKEN